MAAVVWQREPGSLRQFVLRWLVPILALCLLASAAFFVNRRLGLAVLLLTALVLPGLLSAAESSWARRRPRPLHLDRTGMWIGSDLRVKWSEVADLEIGAMRRRLLEVPVVKFKLDDRTWGRPRRSVLWALGLYPGDGEYDFYLAAEYGVPVTEMARVMERLRRAAT